MYVCLFVCLFFLLLFFRLSQSILPIIEKGEEIIAFFRQKYELAGRKQRLSAIITTTTKMTHFFLLQNGFSIQSMHFPIAKFWRLFSLRVRGYVTTYDGKISIGRHSERGMSLKDLGTTL